MIITFFSSIQYIFLIAVPNEVSKFAFIGITNFLGLLFLLAMFYNELFRVDKIHIIQSVILAVQMFAYNSFLLLGSQGLEPKTIGGIIASYFIFVPAIEYVVFKKKIEKNVILGVLMTLVGIFCITDCKIEHFLNKNILFLLISDIIIAIYVISTSEFTRNSNPSMLAMGQLFFNFIFATLFWLVELLIFKQDVYWIYEPRFWGSVIFVSFFIRSLYTVIQTYAQRYVSPLNTSLIFSSEIIMTMFASPIISDFFLFSSKKSTVTLLNILGAVLMIIGILITEPVVIDKISSIGLKHE